MLMVLDSAIEVPPVFVVPVVVSCAPTLVVAIAAMLLFPSYVSYVRPVSRE